MHRSSANGKSTVHPYDRSLFVALELSKSIWLTAVSAPGSEKVSKYRVAAGDAAALWSLLARLKAQAERHRSGPVKIVSIYEAGLDGFWVHRLLEANGVESQRAKGGRCLDRGGSKQPTSQDRSDRRREAAAHADGLGAWRAANLFDGSAAEPGGREDERRLTRERVTLVTERVRWHEPESRGRWRHKAC